MKKTNNTKLKKAIYAMVPVRLPDIDSLFPDKVIADRVRAILQLLFFVRLRMRSNPNFAGGVDRETGYCPVKAKVLKAIAGNNYRKIVDRMLEMDMIQIKINDETGKEAYVPNTWTKLYRIHPKQKLKTFNGRSYRREKITHPDVIRAVKRNYDRHYSEQLKEVGKKGKLYADIVRYGEKFCIDIQRLERDIQNGTIRDDAGLMGQGLAINDKLMRWCHADEFGRRLHTHLGNMPKELRSYLIVKNKPATPLILCDLKNSQPFFLSVLFYKPELLRLIPEFEPVRSILEQHRSRRDVRLFYEDCAAGSFYNKCLVVLGENKKLLKEIASDVRQELKEKLFRHIFYCSPGNYHRNKAVREERQQIQTRFGNVYPGVLADLQSLKRIKRDTLPFVYEITRKGKSKGKMYATPNAMAQRIESKIILDCIASVMFQMNVPVFTIHDAFILEERHAELLKRILDETFTKNLGVKPPMLHITRLTTGQQ
jgi:phosphatidylserine decarboxylase